MSRFFRAILQARRIFCILLILTIGGAPMAVRAAGPDEAKLASVIGMVENHYKSLKDFQADFVQVARILSYPKDQRSEGKVYLKRKEMMRWDYTKPSRDQYFIRGNEVIHYSPEMKQARVITLAAGGGVRSPLVFFEGLKSAEADYAISFNEDPAFDRSKRVILQLTPHDKKRTGLLKILLFVNKKDGQVERVDQYDLYGNVTELYFRNVRVDQGLADSFFVFTPPKGVEMVHQP
jgi:outer membrane lipoprotein carrier protein